MIVFENPGEIDLAAISTFGVSVKESDNPIGFFGTGLKYALAILLRTGHSVTAWAGLAKLEFGTEVAEIRGKEFEIVTMNGERLGFTTEVGKTWELWMAYRELFCNARDEGGEATVAREMPEPMTDRTLIVVQGTAFEAIHKSRWQYFLEDEADHEIDGIEIRHATSSHFFYRGVRVADLPRSAVFTYNDTEAMELTEDRTAKNPYDVPWRIARALLKLRDEGLLRRILMAPKERLEHHLDFHGWHTEPSPQFLKVVGQLCNDGFLDINPTARKVWQECQPQEFRPKLVDLTAVQRKTLDRASEFCARVGFRVGDYPIQVVESLGTDALGLAKDGTIYVAERAFHMGGAKQVAATLIEEWAHLRHSYQDCTRQMQNWLFERMVSLGEELTGEPL